MVFAKGFIKVEGWGYSWFPGIYICPWDYFLDTPWKIHIRNLKITQPLKSEKIIWTKPSWLWGSKASFSRDLYIRYPWTHAFQKGGCFHQPTPTGFNGTGQMASKEETRPPCHRKRFKKLNRNKRVTLEIPWSWKIAMWEFPKIGVPPNHPF